MNRDEVLGQVEALLAESEYQFSLMEECLDLHAQTPWLAFWQRHRLFLATLSHRDAAVRCLNEIDGLREAGVYGPG